MKVASDWKDYEVIATGKGEKLERWGEVYLLRPDPQVIWETPTDMKNYPKLNAHYTRESTGGGKWAIKRNTPEQWIISYKNLKFKIKPMGFKHTGLFPEQAVNWDEMIRLVSEAGRPINVLNLFAYTGGATVALASAGASVTHVDASKGMVERAKENMKLSGLEKAPVRYIVDDCFKFVEREIRRGKKYDAIVLDPPSYGRGPNGEMWKLENNLFDFLKLLKNVLSDNPLFILLNSYTTGLQASVLKNLLSLAFNTNNIQAYEVGLPTKENILLPCGASGMCYFKD